MVTIRDGTVPNTTFLQKSLLCHTGSVSETKMKATRGNGTPYPKVRRFSDEEHSQSHGIQHDEPCQAIRNQTQSSLQKLLDVHTQVTQTLHQIDSTVLNIHTLASSNHIADAEVQGFADALANIDANLQDLNIFLRTAAERSSSLLRNLDQEPSTTGSHESTPPGGCKCSSVSPLITDLEFGAISYSPLVATDLFDCESPNSSEPLTCSPPRDWTGGTRRSTSISPLPQTPCMQSPPRSTRVLSTINESPSPLVAFTTDSAGQVIPRVEDLWTPEPSPCQSRLVFETSQAQVTNGDDGLFSLQTPGFGVSPLRTCDPGKTVPTESDYVTPPPPIMPSPFRTPGIFLEFRPDSRESSSAVSPAISDDLTISVVKRLGPRGLEERLWQELAIRNADVLPFAKFR